MLAVTNGLTRYSDRAVFLVRSIRGGLVPSDLDLGAKEESRADEAGTPGGPSYLFLHSDSWWMGNHASANGSILDAGTLTDCLAIVFNRTSYDDVILSIVLFHLRTNSASQMTKNADPRLRKSASLKNNQQLSSIYRRTFSYPKNQPYPTPSHRWQVERSANLF